MDGKVLNQSASEEKTLAAYHNTNAASLQQALASGGLAVPSLAITEQSVPFDNFGSMDTETPCKWGDTYGNIAQVTSVAVHDLNEFLKHSFVVIWRHNKKHNVE